ncbi:hypothetical protein BsWGS_20804 [Bradybaena similaris]
MDTLVIQRIVGLFILYISTASADIFCGTYRCHGSDAYCCHLSDYEVGCCWQTYVYELWWFWVIWVVVFFLVLACALSCWRRRRAQYRYMVMSNSEYPGYGTVVHSSAVSTTYSAQPGYNAPYAPVPPMYPNAPVAPPSYETAEATKPPAYSN